MKPTVTGEDKGAKVIYNIHDHFVLNYSTCVSITKKILFQEARNHQRGKKKKKKN